MHTRFRIRAAAVELFREQGFNNVTTEQIAARVGVTQRTLFRHFGTKDAILFDNDGIVEFFDQALGRQLALHPPMEAIRLTLLEISGSYDRNAALFRANHQVIIASDMLKAFARQRTGRIDELVARALEGGETFRERAAKPALKSRAAAAALMGPIRELTDAWLEGEVDGSLTDLSRRVWPTMARLVAESLTVPV